MFNSCSSNNKNHFNKAQIRKTIVTGRISALLCGLGWVGYGKDIGCLISSSVM